MKRKNLYQIVAFALLLAASCKPQSSENDKPIRIVSLADLAIQSKLERVEPGGKVDSTFVQSLVTLHDIDQRLCLLAAESEKGNQKAELVGELSSVSGNRVGSVRVMNACCPCNGECCGCVDEDVAAAKSDVSMVTLTSHATNEVIKADTIPLDQGRITAFRFATTPADGTYTMTIVRPNNLPELKFEITYDSKRWSVKKGGFANSPR